MPLEQAEAPLFAALLDKNGAVRLAAASSLKRLGWQPSGAEAAATYAVARKESAYCPNRHQEYAVRPLSAALGFEEMEERIEAASALGRLRSTEAVEPLLALAKSELTANRGGSLLCFGGDRRPAGGRCARQGACNRRSTHRSGCGSCSSWCCRVTPDAVIERQVRMLTSGDKNARKRAAEDACSIVSVSSVERAASAQSTVSARDNGEAA